MVIEELIAELQDLAKILPRARVLVTEKAYGTDRLRAAISVRDGQHSMICTDVRMRDNEHRIIIDIAD